MHLALLATHHMPLAVPSAGRILTGWFFWLLVIIIVAAVALPVYFSRKRRNTSQ